jgi:ATP-dependent Clp protease ATP-binding subunit ClpA
MSACCLAQILGRNLEALVGRSQELKEEMKDDFVSVEHLLLAFLDDSRFGANVLATEALDKAKIQEAVKQVRGCATGQEQLCLPDGKSLRWQVPPVLAVSVLLS